MNQITNHKEISFLELIELLRASSIDFSMWWKWKTKTLKSLYLEIKKGETILDYDENWKILRKLQVVWADIFYTSPEWIVFNLREKKQVFNDNRWVRYRKFDYSVWEKMIIGESPIEAMRRWIKEELGIMSIVDIKEWKQDQQLWDSNSYPGLPTDHYRYWFKAILTDEQYNPDWYIEYQKDKTTFFEWRNI